RRVWSAMLRTRGLRSDPIRPHHLVVLVLHDMAVPHVEAGQIEPGLHPGDLPGVGDHGVLVAGLPALRSSGGTAGAEPLPVDDLELNLVNVDGVSVHGEVVDLPDLRGAESRVLRDRLVPAVVHRVPGFIEGTE